MQEYLEHAAPDGTLATLGDLGAEEEFYSTVKDNKRKNKHVHSAGAVAGVDELQRVRARLPIAFECLKTHFVGFWVHRNSSPLLLMDASLKRNGTPQLLYYVIGIQEIILQNGVPG